MNVRRADVTREDVPAPKARVFADRGEDDLAALLIHQVGRAGHQLPLLVNAFVARGQEWRICLIGVPVYRAAGVAVQPLAVGGERNEVGGHRELPRKWLASQHFEPRPAGSGPATFGGGAWP